MISRLIDLLVIRTLRSWAASEANRMGWLGGLGEERRIGRVLRPTSDIAELMTMIFGGHRPRT
jgi:hypothetical protein